MLTVVKTLDSFNNVTSVTTVPVEGDPNTYYVCAYVNNREIKLAEGSYKDCFQFVSNCAQKIPSDNFCDYTQCNNICIPIILNMDKIRSIDVIDEGNIKSVQITVDGGTNIVLSETEDIDIEQVLQEILAPYKSYQERLNSMQRQ